MVSKEEQDQIKDEINLLLTRVHSLKAKLPKIHRDSHIKNTRYSKEFYELFKVKEIHEQFSVRETEVLLFLSQGMTNAKIADQMFISEKAVKFHLSKIYKTLRMKTRLEVGIWLSQFKNKEAIP